MQQAARFGARQAARGGVRMQRPDRRRKARRSEAGWGARRRWRRIRPSRPSRTRCARFPVPRERPFRPCVQREGRPCGRPRAPVPRASRACRAPASTVSRACSFRRSPPSFPLGWREVLLCPMPGETASSPSIIETTARSAPRNTEWRVVAKRIRSAGVPPSNHTLRSPSFGALERKVGGVPNFVASEGSACPIPDDGRTGSRLVGRVAHTGAKRGRFRERKRRREEPRGEKHG